MFHRYRLTSFKCFPTANTLKVLIDIVSDSKTGGYDKILIRRNTQHCDIIAYVLSNMYI